MAWEWVSPVSVAVVGGIGLWATFRTGREGRKHAETVAREAHAHAERMARDARQQKRLEEAYVELLQMIERAGHWTGRVLPAVDLDPQASLPDLPSVDEQFRVRARVQAYGSPEVRELTNEYLDCINEFVVAHRIVQFAQTQPLHAGEMERQHRLKVVQELQPEESTKRRELYDRVSLELRTGAT